MNMEITEIFNFILKLDALKSVNRRSYINGGERRENSAEHSWHLAMACWAFAQYSKEDYDLKKIIQLALIHDLGEIEAGDTFLYSSERSNAHIREREGVTKLAEDPGNPIEDLAALWEEQEAGESREARLVKVFDRLVPFLHNIASNGRAWREHEVEKSQVLKMHEFIAKENPEIFKWVALKVDYAVEQGWLKDSQA